MKQLISTSKGFSSPQFDTYIPQISDIPDITIALKLFFFGNSDSGNDIATNGKSLYTHLINLDNIVTPTYNSLISHTSATSGVHGIGLGNVVGTTTIQELKNKTLTQPYILSPKINENIALTATSSKLNILTSASVTTAELNKLSGTTFTTTELNYLSGASANIQTQLNSKRAINYTGLILINQYTFTDGVYSFAFGSYSSKYNNYKIIISGSASALSGIYLYYDFSTTNYYSSYNSINFSGTGSSGTVGPTSGQIGWFVGNGAPGGFYSEIDVFNPYLLKPTTIKYTNVSYGTNGSYIQGNGINIEPSQGSSVGFHMANPGVVGNGIKVSLYGYNTNSIVEW